MMPMFSLCRFIDSGLPGRRKRRCFWTLTPAPESSSPFCEGIENDAKNHASVFDHYLDPRERALLREIDTPKTQSCNQMADFVRNRSVGDFAHRSPRGRGGHRNRSTPVAL